MGCHQTRQEGLRDWRRGESEACGGAGLTEALGVSQGEHELGERAAKFDNHLCPFLAVWLQAIYNFSEPQFHYLYNGNKGHNTHFTGLL